MKFYKILAYRFPFLVACRLVRALVSQVTRLLSPHPALHWRSSSLSYLSTQTFQNNTFIHQQPECITMSNAALIFATTFFSILKIILTAFGGYVLAKKGIFHKQVTKDMGKVSNYTVFSILCYTFSFPLRPDISSLVELILPLHHATTMPLHPLVLSCYHDTLHSCPKPTLLPCDFYSFPPPSLPSLAIFSHSSAGHLLLYGTLHDLWQCHQERGHRKSQTRWPLVPLPHPHPPPRFLSWKDSQFDLEV